MIMLENLAGDEFCLNSNLIYKIDETPDTVITLTNGKVLRVKNNTKDIIEKVVEYKRKIYIDSMEGVK